MSNKDNPVVSKDDFVSFVNDLRKDFTSESSVWENASLDSYLSAIGAWVADMEGYYSNHKIDWEKKTCWGLFADILSAAKMYE